MSAIDTLRQQVAPVSEARPSELLPLSPTLGTALDLPGLRRGSTLAVSGSSGATSLAVSLLAAPTTAGMWCAVVGLPDLGLVAVNELGVDLDRLALVAAPERRAANSIAALIEGCDALLLAFPLSLTRAEALRLAARARQRGVVLVVLAGSAGRVAVWPEAPDVTVVVRRGELLGISPGAGRITGRRCELVTSKRRGAPEPLVASWFVGQGAPEVGKEPTAASGTRRTRKGEVALARASSQ